MRPVKIGQFLQHVISYVRVSSTFGFTETRLFGQGFTEQSSLLVKVDQVLVEKRRQVQELLDPTETRDRVLTKLALINHQETIPGKDVKPALQMDVVEPVLDDGVTFEDFAVAADDRRFEGVAEECMGDLAGFERYVVVDVPPISLAGVLHVQ